MRVLETSRLRIREVTSDDAAFILELLNEAPFIQHIGDRGLRSPADARGYIEEKLLSSYEKFGYGLYAVEEKNGDTALGVCGFVKRDNLEHADLGYAFLERHWRRGYAHEAAQAVLHYGRATLGFDEVFGIVAPGNQSSIRLLEKLGFRFNRMIFVAGVATERKLFSVRIDSLPDGQSDR